MGDEGWCYESPLISSNEQDGSNGDSKAHEGEEAGAGVPTSVAEIRRIIVQLAKREDR